MSKKDKKCQFEMVNRRRSLRLNPSYSVPFEPQLPPSTQKYTRRREKLDTLPQPDLFNPNPPPQPQQSNSQPPPSRAEPTYPNPSLQPRPSNPQPPPSQLEPTKGNPPPQPQQSNPQPPPSRVEPTYPNLPPQPQPSNPQSPPSQLEPTKGNPPPQPQQSNPQPPPSRAEPTYPNLPPQPQPSNPQPPPSNPQPPPPQLEPTDLNPPPQPQPSNLQPPPLEPEPTNLNSPPEPQPSDPLPVPTEPQPPPYHPVVLDDDGRRRCRMREPLRYFAEALQASGKELLSEHETVAVKKRKRNTKKDGDGARSESGAMSTNVRCGRGLGKPRDPVPPQDRPNLLVVGDGEFTSIPKCTKVITTIRLLTLENMPGPYRSYNMFPVEARLCILHQFLQRYSWGPDEDVGCCLDVFENIAADAYCNELTERRGVCRENLGEDKEVWKDFPPRWCKNVEYWKGLCDIWLNEAWEHQSKTNRFNKTKHGHVVSHVAGSRSMYRHKQALASELGPTIGMKHVFDRTHLVDTPSGKVYCNQKAQETAENFDGLKEVFGEEIDEEQLWELAACGEDRGRLFGFGYRSRTRFTNRATGLSQSTNPTKSTATSSENIKTSYTPDEVAELVSQKIAAAQSGFVDEIAAQEMRHKAELEEVQKRNEYYQVCIETLFRATGARPPPPFNGGSSEESAGGGNRGGNNPQP